MTDDRFQRCRTRRGSALVIANERFLGICYDVRKILALPKAKRQRPRHSKRPGIAHFLGRGAVPRVFERSSWVESRKKSFLTQLGSASDDRVRCTDWQSIIKSDKSVLSNSETAKFLNLRAETSNINARHLLHQLDLTELTAPAPLKRTKVGSKTRFFRN